MRTSIRQGIIRASGPGGPLNGPPFLQFNAGPGTISLLATPATPVIVTVAHHGANYLIEEITNQPNAWGGGNGPGAPASFDPQSEVTRGENNDVLAASSTKKYLFWDIDLSTGAVRKGWTPLPPLSATVAPVNPQHGQHWFDSGAGVMRVWHRPNLAPGHWREKVRAFAAAWDPGSPGNIDFNAFPIGASQGGLPVGDYAAGNIIFGTNGKPLRAGNVLVTTEDQLIIAQTSGQNVKFDAALVFATADEEIPAFSCVTFTPQRRIKLASYLDTAHFVCGIVIEPLHENETGQVISNGVVRNEQWLTTPLADGKFLKDNIGAPIFINVSGQLTLTPPPLGCFQQVAFTYDDTAIYFNLFPPVLL